MILSDSAIRHALTHQRLVITPFEDRYIQPNSYDIHLHKYLLLPRNVVDEFNTQVVVEPEIDTSALWYGYNLFEEPLVIQPGDVILGRTVEYFQFLKVSGRLEGVSSLGRIFLSVHTTAGFFDYGFTGTATIEIKNNFVYPIRLREGMRIGQMVFEEVAGVVAKPYRGRYKDQINATAAKAPNTGS